MAGFKEKFQVFFIGLLLGLILGGSFFLFKLDQYVKELSIYKSFTQHKETATEDHSVKDTKSADKTQQKLYSPVRTGSPAASAASRDSMHLAQMNSGARKSTSDSLHSMDTTISASEVSEDIVLRKDELISARSIEILNISPVALNSGSQHDSIAAKLAGVRDDHVSGRQFASVEFWSSPVNYRGYKMSHSKIVLYGLSDHASGREENLKLFKLDDEMYLQYGPVVFHLEYSNEFHPYEKVVSEGVLAKIK
jgi:hypothetical protein